jgi:hypothetical protein
VVSAAVSATAIVDEDATEIPEYLTAELDSCRRLVAAARKNPGPALHRGAACVFRTVTKDTPDLFRAAVDEIYSIANAAGMMDDDATQKIINDAIAEARMQSEASAQSYEADPIIQAWERNDPRNKQPANGHDAEPAPESDAYGAVTAKDNRGASLPMPEPTPVLLSKAQFLVGYTPPDWFWDGIMQRRFVYSITAKTGHGKTAVFLLIAEKAASRDRRDTTIGGHQVDEGNVIYFAGENPDDLRNRMIASDHLSGRDCSQDRISIIPGTFGGIDAMRAECEAKIAILPGGKVDFVVVDTSAAYFLGDDENNNPQMGGHARKIRTLTTLPGGPCVGVLCHPVKNANEQSALLPRGGGAFIAEVDGNLTLWLTDDVTELWHTGKLRGPGFEPISFRLERVTCEALVDTKGRMSPTVRAVAITDTDKDDLARTVRSAEDAMLVAILEQPRPIAGLAAACGWVSSSGEPQKSKAHRILKGLEKSGLVRLHRGTYELTERGDKAAKTAVRTPTAK